MPAGNPVAVAPILRVEGGRAKADQDLVAVEAPLLVHVQQDDTGMTRQLGVLMRTPGHDRDLVTGLLLTEGVIQSAGDIVGVAHTRSAESDETAERLDVRLAASVDLNAWSADRAMLATTACGLCGRLSVRGLNSLARPTRHRTVTGVPATLLSTLPARLRERQAAFDETGGLHAAGLFTSEGEALGIREDVGRHNAVDKVIGLGAREGWLTDGPLILVVSSRIAYEIVQKAAAAGCAMVVAVGAPSDLAIAAARAAGMTLIGFARDGRFNIYTGAELVGCESAQVLPEVVGDSRVV